jgi:hypothetical protein
MSSNETTPAVDSVAQAALAAIEGHPLQREAIGWSHCATDVFTKSKALVEGFPLAEEEKDLLRVSLADVETVLVVGYWTSVGKPKPLAGGGKHYVFLLHTNSLAVLHVGVGTWRS